MVSKRRAAAARRNAKPDGGCVFPYCVLIYIYIKFICTHTQTQTEFECVLSRHSLDKLGI